MQCIRSEEDGGLLSDGSAATGDSQQDDTGHQSKRSRPGKHEPTSATTPGTDKMEEKAAHLPRPSAGDADMIVDERRESSAPAPLQQSAPAPTSTPAPGQTAVTGEGSMPPAEVAAAAGNGPPPHQRQDQDLAASRPVQPEQTRERVRRVLFFGTSCQEGQHKEIELGSHLG